MEKEGSSGTSRSRKASRKTKEVAEEVLKKEEDEKVVEKIEKEKEEEAKPKRGKGKTKKGKTEEVDEIPKNKNTKSSTKKSITQTEEKKVETPSNKEDEDSDVTNMFEMMTEDGTAIKILCELLYNVMGNDIPLMVTKKGIFYTSQNEKGSIAAQFHLERDKFATYITPSTLQSEKDGLLLVVPSKQLKQSTQAQTKEKIRMYITKEEPYVLVIDIIGKTPDLITTNKITLGANDNYIPTNTPKYKEDLQPSARIEGRTIVAKCKSIEPFGRDAILTAQKNAFRIECGGKEEGGSTTPTFGTWKDDQPVLFKGKFASKAVVHISKIGNISDYVNIYSEKGKPLKIVGRVKNLGPFYFHLYVQ
jgi:hypothetical protein